jgi:hypothetical protein
VRTLRIRYQIERVLAALCGVAFLLNLFLPQWIELLTGTSPDGGDGDAEWLVSIGLLVATVCFSAFARRDHRRLKAATT